MTNLHISFESNNYFMLLYTLATWNTKNKFTFFFSIVFLFLCVVFVFDWLLLMLWLFLSIYMVLNSIWTCFRWHHFKQSPCLKQSQISLPLVTVIFTILSSHLCQVDCGHPLLSPRGLFVLISISNERSLKAALLKTKSDLSRKM